MSPKNKNKNRGFTLIEMIVSLGIFSIVVTTAVGALLILITTNQQLQAEQNVMTNLSFALDTMTREIRTGFNYFCADSGSGHSLVFTGANNHENLGNNTRDCSGGRIGQRQGLSFFEGGNSITGSTNTRILYFYDATARTIFRRIGNGTPESIVSSGLRIEDMQFYLTGSDNLEDDSDDEQPTVTIYIEAMDRNDPDSKSYYLQTTVTQRILDL